MADCTLEDLYFQYVLIRLNDPSDHDLITEIADELEDCCSGEAFKTYEQVENTDKIQSIMDKVFYGLIGVTMFLCFFSLSASMSANLFEQKKEIGVIRAMGFTKYRVRMLYFYEALILVLSSSFLGVMIGTLVGYTMLLQFNLILATQVEFFFPTKQFVLVVILSIICAFFSTWGPAVNLTNRSISGIFRMV